MPFLKLTRDRRGFENTFLMHAARPGDRPKLLYWYRTAPGIVQGRSPLDEDAIRTIEDQHPDIDFDWPAILALAEVMTPEDEAPARPPQQPPRRRERGRDRNRPAPGREHPSAAREESAEPQGDGRVDQSGETARRSHREVTELQSDDVARDADGAAAIEAAPPSNRLVEELAGREIGSRLRSRHAEILSRIAELDVDGSVKDGWFARAEALDPELWMTPEAVLEGVRNADAIYDTLKAALQSARE